jgi:class 3 adenylate cyclase
MPIYMDRHDALGATAQQVADAHNEDMAVQERHGVHYHTYWFDPDDGTIFCLAEGPSKESIEAVHREAHGLMASSIMEIDSSAPLNAFMGTFPSHAAGTAYVAPAIRIILFTDVCGSVAQTFEIGDEGHMTVLRDHDEIVREELATHHGREVKHTGDGIMASFDSVASCVAFAVAVQRRVHSRNQEAAVPIALRVGMNAGEPVTGDHDDLFGAAVQLAARLCAAAGPHDILASVAVRELCMGKQFRFEDRGDTVIKGLPAPVKSFAVLWAD